MAKLRRRLLCAAAPFIVLVVLFVSVFAFLPKFVDTELVRSAVQSQVSEKLGAQISYRSTELFFFPRPRVILHDGTLTVRDRLRSSFGSLEVRPKVLPLLWGNLEISSLRIAAPVASIRFERLREKEFPSLEELRGDMRRLFSTLAGKAPNLGISIEKGNVTLIEGDQTVFSFKDLDAAIVFPPGGPRIRITCSSDFAETVKVAAQFDQGSLSGSGEIALRGVRIQPLWRYLMRNGPVWAEGSVKEINLRFRTTGMKRVEAEGSSSLYTLLLKRRGKQLTIKGEALIGGFLISDDRTEVSLRELSLSYPRLILAGTLLNDRSGRQIGLNVEGRGIDIRSMREAAYPFAWDIPIVQSIFSYLKAGTVPRITVSSQAGSFEALGNTENIRIRGRIENGEVYVKGPRLDFSQVYGDCVVINGMLEGTGLDAALDSTRLQGGRLRVGLKGEIVPLGLDARVSVDLTMLRTLLLRLLKNEAVVHEISLIRQVKGRARGRLIMGGNSASPTVVADVQDVDLTADYLRIPYPVRILQGQVFYDGRRVATRNLRGAIGSSLFSGLTASLELERGFLFDISSGSFDISLPEVHRWLVSYETLRPSLDRIGSVGGRLSLASVRLRGPLLRPEEWRFRTSGSGQDIAFTSSSLPGSVAVARTNIEATETKMTASDTHLRMLDSAVDLSGEVDGYLKEVQKLDLRMKGSVGPGSFRWLSDTLRFPPWVRRSLRLSVASAHFVGERNGAAAFSGAVKVEGGPEVSLDMVSDREGLRFKRLFIEDSSSKADISFALDGGMLGLGFSGKMTGQTAASVIDINGSFGGRVSGDFRGEVSLKRPVRFNITGDVAADGVVIPLKETVPLEIDDLSARAQGQRIRLDSCDLKWGGDSLTLRGDLMSSEKGISVDMDASAAVIDAASIEKKIKRKGKEGQREESSAFVSPARGIIRLRAGRLRYGKVDIVPLGASILLENGGLGVDVTEAGFCGISLPGRAKIAGGEISLDFRPSAKQESLESTFSCLSHSFDMNEYATGTFDLSGKITGKGPGEDIGRWIESDIDFTARDGRIYQEPSILKILAFLEITEIAKGYGDVWRKGLAYDKVEIKSRLRGGRIDIEEGTLDGSYTKMAARGYVDSQAAKMDIKVLVSPLRTIDRIIEKIPVLGRILGGTLLSIPVRVSGDIKDPQVSPFSFSSADSGLLGIMKKTLTLPFKIFTPLLPDKKDREKEGADRQ